MAGTDANVHGVLSTDVFNLIDVDPLLGPLADNGGSTQTHALLPGSPALDAGDPNFTSPPDFDQRGAPNQRVATGVLAGIPTNLVDIGAYEAQGPPSADFVDDNIINGADFLAWQRGFGMTAGVSQANGDSDYDNDVDASDLASWLSSYGQAESPPPPVQAVATSETAVSGKELINAALALDWLRVENKEESRDMAEPPIVEALLGATIATDNLAPVVGDANDLAAASAASDLGETDDQPWLADELLERVFG
jgi:hypothetical protein